MLFLCADEEPDVQRRGRGGGRGAGVCVCGGGKVQQEKQRLAAETWGEAPLPAHQLWTVREISLVVS